MFCIMSLQLMKNFTQWGYIAMDEKDEKKYYIDRVIENLEKLEDLELCKYFCAFIEKKIELRKAGK